MAKIIKFEIERKEDDDIRAYFLVSGQKDYSIQIKTKGDIAVISPMDCSCEFGSYWSQTKKNKEESKICRHLRGCVELLVYLNYINRWEIK